MDATMTLQQPVRPTRRLPMGLVILGLGALGGALLARAGAPPALAGIALTSLAGMAALNLLEAALWERPIEKAIDAAEGHPLRACLAGLLSVMMLVLIWNTCRFTALAPVAGLFVLMLTLIAMLVGLPAVCATLVGRRLEPSGSKNAQIIWGTAVLMGTMMVPVLGWLLALGVCLAGLGGGVLALVAS
ncbi:MAG: hypothetical protein AB7S38_07200 [Vulcanimicrobiota bacterium]